MEVQEVESESRPIPSRVGQVVRFCVWALLGGALCFGVLGLLSIGIFVLVPTALVAVVFIVLTGVDRSVAGLLAGPSIPMLLVAWFNKDGPGDVCRAVASGQECSSEMSPWPWLVTGVVAVIVGVVAFHAVGPSRSASSRT